MTMFLGHEVRATDPGLKVVYAHFRRNLEDILDTARRANVPVVLSTIGVNLKDNPPFGSQHRPDLSPTDEKRWKDELDAGVAAEDAHRYADALASYARAAAIDPQATRGRCVSRRGGSWNGMWRTAAGLDRHRDGSGR